MKQSESFFNAIFFLKADCKRPRHGAAHGSPWQPTGFVLKASFGAAQVIPEANGVAPQLEVTVTVTINPKARASEQM